MIELLRFIFQSFWVFIGFTIILGLSLEFLIRLIYIILRSIHTLRRYKIIDKYGWPPNYCDSDGNYKKNQKEC
jgi:hypothetical protein